MVTVTIAMTTFNGARYLPEQLDSLSRQTFEDFEVIVGDDGSDDGTVEVLERHAALDRRFRIVRNAPRKGLQRNFETVIAQAGGRWIAPCDQDDVWEPEKLETLLAATTDPEVVLAYSDSMLVDADGRPLGLSAFESMTAIDGGEPLCFAFANCISGHAMMFDRRLLSVALPFPDVPIYDWWIAAAATSVGRVVRVDRPLVRYRQHGANVTDMAGLRKRANRKAVTEPRWLLRDREVSERLDAFSRLPGPVGEAYRRLADLWEERRRSWLSPGLAVFAWRNRAALWAIRPGTAVRDAVRVGKFGIGRRWRARPDAPSEKPRRGATS